MYIVIRDCNEFDDHDAITIYTPLSFFTEHFKVCEKCLNID